MYIHDHFRYSIHPHTANHDFSHMSHFLNIRPFSTKPVGRSKLALDILHEKRTFSEEHFRQSGMSCDPVANYQIQSDANEEANRSSKKYRMFCDIIKTLLTTMLCKIKCTAGTS